MLAWADSEVITTIILINREAELVDLNSDGEVLKRYVAVPDYFSSGRSHTNSLKKSLQLLKDYGHVPDYNLPGSSDLSANDLQSYMLENMKPRVCEQASLSLYISDKDIDSDDTNYLEISNSREIVALIASERIQISSKSMDPPSSFADVFYPSLDQETLKQQDLSPQRSYYNDVRTSKASR